MLPGNIDQGVNLDFLNSRASIKSMSISMKSMDMSAVQVQASS